MKKIASILLMFSIIFSASIHSVASDIEFTRGSFCTKIVELLEIEYDVSGIPEIFTDVSTEEEHHHAIITMYMLGYMSGYEDGKFRPDNPITKGEVATRLVDMIVGDFSVPDDVVLGDAWYAKHAWKATQLGLMPNVQDWDINACESDINIEVIKTYAPLKIFDGESGICGDNLTWELTNKGILTIKGNGVMDSYSSASFTPWFEHRIVEVIIEHGVTSIGKYAFSSCPLTKITLPESIEHINGYAFYDSRLKEIFIPKNVNYIGELVFENCGDLEFISVDSDNPKYCDIEGALFNKDETVLIKFPPGKACNVYTVPDSVWGIKINSFSNCFKIKSIIIPNGTKNIGREAFANCRNLENIIIGEGITTISSSAFIGCARLKSVIIPKNVTYIGYSAFNYCTGLKAISVDSDNTMYCDVDGVLFDKQQKTLICFPAGKESELYIIPNTVEVIEDYAFAHCNALSAVEIPENVKLIGCFSFVGCNLLTDIIIPGSEVDLGAFSGCNNLTTITISEGTRSIGDEVFEDCIRLKKIYVPTSVTYIGKDAFSNGFAKEATCTIYGFSDTYAKEYALSNNIRFVENTEKTSVDITEEGKYIFYNITLSDTIEKEGLKAYVAIYDENGKMIRYNYGDVTSSGLSTISVESSNEAVIAKIFVWENETFIPICDVSCIYL